MARLIAERRGVARERMSIIPNWGDVDAIAAVDLSASQLAGDLGARDKTIIQYSGNIGRTHDIELVLDAARQLDKREDILFLFAGEGGKLPVVKAAAREAGNIVVLPRRSEGRRGGKECVSSCRSWWS